jgi:nucleoside-diphosphate-sugar epimerase
LGVLPLLGSGRQELSLVHARDLAQALILVSTGARTENRIYHAAHPRVVTQRVLVRSIGRALGREVRCVTLPHAVVCLLLGASGMAARIGGGTTLLSPDKAPELLAPAWTCSSEALERDAGWRARVCLEEGLADTAAAYRGAGWL